MSRATIYVGRMDPRTRERDLYDIFDRYGRVQRVDMKRGFAFIDYNDPRDAEDAVRDMDGRDVDGSRIVVEMAGRGGGGRGDDRRGGRGDDRRGGGGGVDRRRAGERPDHTDFRIKIEGVPSSVHWQDLKDYFRKAGDVIFGDVDRRGGGVVEFRRAEDVANAIRQMDGTDWQGTKIRVIDDSGAPAGGSRGGSNGGSRGRSPSPRRGRSPSPRRRSPSPRGRSPRGRSPSPRKRSPSPRGRSPSPKRSPRSPSPKRSPRSPVKPRSPSPEKKD